MFSLDNMYEINEQLIIKLGAAHLITSCDHICLPTLNKCNYNHRYK